RSAARLNDAWYVSEQGVRWMPKRASLKMQTAPGEPQELRVSGYCPRAALRKGPVQLTVSVNGAALKAVKLEKADTPFDFKFPLQSGLPKEIEVAVEVDRTFKLPPDERELGMLFGVFEIKRTLASMPKDRVDVAAPNNAARHHLVCD